MIQSVFRAYSKEAVIVAVRWAFDAAADMADANSQKTVGAAIRRLSARVQFVEKDGTMSLAISGDTEQC